MGMFKGLGKGSGRHTKGGRNYKPVTTSRARKKASQYGLMGNPFPQGPRGRFAGGKVPSVRVTPDAFWKVRGPWPSILGGKR